MDALLTSLNSQKRPDNNRHYIPCGHLKGGNGAFCHHSHMKDSKPAASLLILLCFPLALCSFLQSLDQREQHVVWNITVSLSDSDQERQQLFLNEWNYSQSTIITSVGTGVGQQHHFAVWLPEQFALDAPHPVMSTAENIDLSTETLKSSILSTECLIMWWMGGEISAVHSENNQI